MGFTRNYRYVVSRSGRFVYNRILGYVSRQQDVLAESAGVVALSVCGPCVGSTLVHLLVRTAP